MAKRNHDGQGISPGWQRRLIPELLRCRSDREREELWQKFHRHDLFRNLLTVSVVSALICGCLGLLWRRWVSPLGVAGSPWVIGVACWFAAMAVVLGFNCLRVRPYRRFLRAELHARGVAICRQCGYDLTGNVSGVCPECGAAIEVKVEGKAG
jgi:hypothetical protein